MAPKRALFSHNSDSAAFSPATPVKSKRQRLSLTSPASGASTSYSQLSTPYSIPSDSPSNPFGLARSAEILLPRAISFAKHLPLRFQVVRDGVAAKGNAKAKGKGKADDAPFRVVQVPTNYSFRHLQKLVLFLFHGDLATETRSRKRKPRSRKATEKEIDQGRGHIFEVQADASLYAMTQRPGQIKSGRVSAKLSDSWDYYCHRRALTDDPLSTTDVLDDDADEDWRWEGEEDFTIANVWPKGPDLKRVIIYRHSPQSHLTWEVHITINTLKLPPRRGVGNTPFVFFARDCAFDLNRPLPIPPEAEDDTNELADALHAWNHKDAFAAFLKRVSAAHQQEAAADEDDEDDYDEASSAVWSSCSGSEPYDLPLITPAPTRQLHRLRVDMAGRRMLRLTHRGMSDMDDELDGGEDEEKEEDELEEDAVDGKGAEKEEVDELSDDRDDIGEVEV